MADISQVNLPDGSSFDIKDATARSNKADKVALPSAYDPTSPYAIGWLVTYNNKIYQCNTTISTAEEWNPNHWNSVYPDTDYLHSINPKGNGSFSLNRKGATAIGNCSFAEGYHTTASGNNSHAEGYITTASGYQSHAEGTQTTASGYSSHAEGSNTTASGDYSHAEGYATTTSGKYSHAEGIGTYANHKSQHVFGEYNVLDYSADPASNRGDYVEIVGNGTANGVRSNARTLDWNGNEVLAGNLKINGTQDVAAQVSLTQAEYDALVQAGTVDLVNTVYFITDGNANANSASETTYDNTSSGLTATNVQDAIDEVAADKGEVTQINKTDNETYSLLLATDNTTTTDTGNVYKSSFLKYNPSTQILNLCSSSTPDINSVEINPKTGGKIFVRNVSTTYPSTAALTTDAGGGHIYATTPGGVACVSLNGTSTGGVITLTDHNRTENIVLTGSTGSVSCVNINGYTPWTNIISKLNVDSSGLSITLPFTATTEKYANVFLINPHGSTAAMMTLRPSASVCTLYGTQTWTVSTTNNITFKLTPASTSWGLTTVFISYN